MTARTAVGVLPERHRLEVDGARQLQVHATQSEVHLRGIERLNRLQAADSQVDLDLTEIRHDPSLELTGTTEAQVELKIPCYFQMDRTQLLSSQVEVNGCGLWGESHRRNRLDRRGLDGNRRVVLTARLTEDATLEVDGQ